MRTAQEQIQTAQTILNQIGGGGKVRAMTGAKSFDATENGLYIKLPRSRSIRIELDPSDTYTVTMTTVRNYKYNEQTAEGIYAEDLVETLEGMTGLYFHL